MFILANQNSRCSLTNANIAIKLAKKIMAHSDSVGMDSAEDAEAKQENKVLAALVPPAVMTSTLAVPAGVVQVVEVAEAAL